MYQLLKITAPLIVHPSIFLFIRDDDCEDWKLIWEPEISLSKRTKRRKEKTSYVRDMLWYSRSNYGYFISYFLDLSWKKNRYKDKKNSSPAKNNKNIFI